MKYDVQFYLSIKKKIKILQKKQHKNLDKLLA